MELHALEKNRILQWMLWCRAKTLVIVSVVQQMKLYIAEENQFAFIHVWDVQLSSNKPKTQLFIRRYSCVSLCWLL